VRRITGLAVIFLCLSGGTVARAAGLIYWSNSGDDTIGVATLDGMGMPSVLPIPAQTLFFPTGLAIDSASGRLYISNEQQNQIVSANLDGSGVSVVFSNSTNASSPFGLAIDPALGRLYWAGSFEGGGIAYGPLDGSATATLQISGATVMGPSGLTIDPTAGRIYWANYSGGAISSAKLDGTGAADLPIPTADVNQPFGIAVDPAAGRIYWTNSGNGTIFAANLDGSNPVPINTAPVTPSAPTGVAVDPAAGRIYWTDGGSGQISYANLNGAGGANLGQAAGTKPEFPILLEPPVPAGAPMITGGRTTGAALTCSPGSWEPDLLGDHLYRAPQTWSYQWSLSGHTIAGATSNPTVARSPGSYGCQVTASNHAGSALQASAAHAVSPPPPNTKLTNGSVSSRKHQATFKFKAVGTATGFQCALVNGKHAARFTRCKSPKTYKHLHAGKYKFEVRAIGPGGLDATPATERFKISRR
jgi:DNA-binding beta-propeller fold protein YncE